MTPCGSLSSLIWPVGTRPYPSWWLRAPPGSQAQAGHKHKSTLQVPVIFFLIKGDWLCRKQSSEADASINQQLVWDASQWQRSGARDTRGPVLQRAQPFRKWVAG